MLQVPQLREQFGLLLKTHRGRRIAGPDGDFTTK